MQTYLLIISAFISAGIAGSLYGYWHAVGIELFRNPVRSISLTTLRIISLATTLCCLLNLPATGLILVMVFLATSWSLTFTLFTRRT